MPLRTEILKGLPGNGPSPLHFHSGHPTPWSEGVAVRFVPEIGQPWIGNFQSGSFGETRLLEWHEAEAIIVIAKGQAYFVPVSNSTEYRCLGDDARDTLMDQDRSLLLIVCGADLAAVRQDGSILWRRGDLGLHDIELESCECGVLMAQVANDCEGPWDRIGIDTRNGRTI